MQNSIGRVLVIDDEQQVRTMLSEMLRRLRYDPESADDGTAGLAKFREDPPDLVIVDMRMPDRDGIDVIREIRRAGGTPIIALSGHSEKMLLGAAKSTGANGVLTKPVELEELVDALNEAFSPPSLS